MAEAKAFQFDQFLFKPFSPDDLQRALRQVLDPNTPRPQPPDPERIRAEIRSLSQLPVMPDSHTRLLQLLGKPDEAVDLNLVAKTVELDPALTLKVMRICRSAFFGFQGDGMLQALIFLGVENIRQIVQSAMVTSVFTASSDRSGAFTMQALWRHCLATGLVMAALNTGDKKSLYFMTGLLHDVGKAIFHFRFPEYFAHAVELAANECIPLIQAERELFGITHAQCGGELASHWHLPSEIHTGITAHHKPAIATKSRRLAALVHLADIAVRQMAIGSGGDNLIPSVDPLAKRLIPALRPIFERRDALVEQVDSILGPDTSL